jgi:hypothetical protein
MFDIAVLVCIVFLVGAAIAWARSLTWVTLALLALLSLMGAGIQATLAWNLRWTFRELQVGLVAGLVVIAAVAWRVHRQGRSGFHLRRQLLLIGGPIVAIALAMVVLRLMADGSPGALTGVGWLAGHPAAEDNAKWLNLAAQLSSGQELQFNGYAGGPLVLLIVLVATGAAVLSQILLGGFNEVAVAVNAVIGTEFLLIALAPLALAPLAEYRIPRPPRVPGFPRTRVPGPALWAGLLVSVPATAVLLAYGHMTLEYVLLVVGLWVTVFLVGGPGRSRLIACVAVIATSSVWFPLNGIALALLVIGWIVVVARLTRGGRDWVSVAFLVAVTVVMWDALISSTFFILGVGVPEAAGSGAPAVVAGARLPRLDIPLLEAGGGTESATAILALLASAGMFSATWILSRGWASSRSRQLLALGPLLALVAYAVAIGVADAFFTGNAPNYGADKVGYMVAVVIASTTLPIALTAIDIHRTGMTLLRWTGLAVIALALAADTLLPRGLSQVSSAFWAGPDKDQPPFWASVEVKQVANQPISSVPIACVFLPPGAEKPSGQPDGQAAYNCTRLLIGLGGAEGRVGGLMQWITTDWLANGSYWYDWYDSISGTTEDIKGRTVILLGSDGSVVGFDTLRSLLERYPPPAM